MRAPTTPTLFPYTTLFRSDQDGAEPLERPEDGPVDHDRAVAVVVLADVLHVEPFGQREVALHCGQLPQPTDGVRSEEHTSELQSQFHLVCRLLLEKKNQNP